MCAMAMATCRPLAALRAPTRASARGMQVAALPRPAAQRRLQATVAVAATAETCASPASTSNVVPLPKALPKAQSFMAWESPPATGRTEAELLVPFLPGAFSMGGCQDYWSPSVHRDLNADVHPGFAGLQPAEVAQAVHCHMGGVLAAIDEAGRSLNSANAAATLLRLDAAVGPALSLVAPGGSSALLAVPAFGLLPLLERAAACAAQLSAGGHHDAALATAAAALGLVSRLRFGSNPVAQPYAAAALQLKRAVAAAVKGGAAVTEQRVLALTATCARADSRLWLAPSGFGGGWAAAVHGMCRAGWSSVEAALQYIEAWCRLVCKGHKAPCAASYHELVAPVAERHRLTSVAQLDRLLATEAALPAGISCQMNTKLAEWQGELLQRRSGLVQAEQRRAHAAAATSLRSCRRALEVGRPTQQRSRRLALVPAALP